MRTIKTLNCEAPQICFFFRFPDLILEFTIGFDVEEERRRKKKKPDSKKLQRGREKPSEGRERERKKNERVNKNESGF
mgnify:CR=1 FL=1